MTRVDAGLLAVSACYLVAGFSVLYALGLARRARDVRHAGLAYLTGWGAIGIALTAAIMLGVGPTVPALLTATAAVAAVCLLVGRRRDAEPHPGARRVPSLHPLPLAACLAAGAILVTVGLAAVALSLRGVTYASYWDTLLFWLPKAQIVFHFGKIEPAAWLQFPHPEYPPLQPVMDAATFHAVGGVHPSVLPLQRTLLGLAFLGAALGLIDAYTPRWLSLPSLALLAVTPWFWWRLQAGIADQPLAYLVTVAAIALVLWLREPRTTWLLLALVLLTAGSLTKLEGALFALPLVLAVLAAGLARFGRAALPALVLLLAPAAIVPWRLWLRLNDLPSSAADYRLTDVFDPGFLAGRASRVVDAADWILSAPFHQLQTGVAVIGCFVVLATVASRLPAIAAAVAAWMALSVAGLLTIYWIGDLEVQWYLSTSAGRVGATVVVTAATLTPLLLGLALERRASEPGAD